MGHLKMVGSSDLNKDTTKGDKDTELYEVPRVKARSVLRTGIRCHNKPLTGSSSVRDTFGHLTDAWRYDPYKSQKETEEGKKRKD